jgi:hypothetical protein
VKKAVIFIADSNPVGPGHKLILPAIRYMYVKRGIQCKIINPYRDGFDPTSTTNMGADGFTRAYKHEIKIADHIHFITSAHLGGVSPVMEGLFEHVLVNGFAYNRPNRARKKMFKKQANFYIIYNHDTFKINPLWARLKWVILKQIFNGGDVFQFNPKDFTKDRREITQKLNKRLIKLFN